MLGWGVRGSGGVSGRGEEGRGTERGGKGYMERKEVNGMMDRGRGKRMDILCNAFLTR